MGGGGGTATATANVDGAPGIPTKENPVIVVIYGQICVAAKSYQSAIFYLLHAYDHYLNEPMTWLSHHRFNREGHVALIRQPAPPFSAGNGVLTKYRKLQGTTMAGVREVEYNFGRTFHQLGLHSHAVKHYERVLELPAQAGDSLYAIEAAFSLSCIFVFTGAAPSAEALYRKLLSL